MNAKEILHYVIIGLFTFGSIYIIIYKTELLINKTISSMIMAIIYIILNQSFIKSQEGKNGPKQNT